MMCIWVITDQVWTMGRSLCEALWEDSEMSWPLVSLMWMAGKPLWMTLYLRWAELRVGNWEWH